MDFYKELWKKHVQSDDKLLHGPRSLSDAHLCHESTEKQIDKWFSILLSKYKQEFVNYISYVDGLLMRRLFESESFSVWGLHKKD